jgi:hypothetical protein
VRDTPIVEQNTCAPESAAQAADRILLAWRNGQERDLRHELENARKLATQNRFTSTLEMEVMEVLSGAVESLTWQGGKSAGAVRLLEHLAASRGLA